MVDVTSYSAEALHQFAARVLELAGVPPADAALAADVLLAADLRGIDSHGVARLRGYFEALRFGIDFGTSAVAFGKIEIARRKGDPIPLGWAIAADGRPTTDPTDVYEGGALLPVGSTRELGGHKGYALAMMVDVLSGVLSGANWGPFAPAFAIEQEPRGSVGRGIGHFFGALRIDGFIDPDEFRRQIDHLVRTFRATA